MIQTNLFISIKRTSLLLLIVLTLGFIGLSQAYSATFNDGTILNVYALNTTHVMFKVTMTDNRYFGIGFGSSMAGVDILIW